MAGKKFVPVLRLWLISLSSSVVPIFVSGYGTSASSDVAVPYTRPNFSLGQLSHDTRISDSIDISDIEIDSTFVSDLEASFRRAESQHLVNRQQGNPTRDELINGECNDVIVIFARGTGGVGNVGLGLGPSFLSKLEAALPGRVIAQGVLPYAADVAGYLEGGSAEGGRSMKALTERAAKQCPDAQIVLSGYSQGAQVTHRAAGLLPTSLYDRITAIVTFGDPKRTQPFPGVLNSKVLVICNTGDLICEGKPIIKEEHSSEAYEPRMPEAIAWIKTRVLQNGLPTTTRVVSKTSTPTALTNTTVHETSTSLVTQVPVSTTLNSTSDSPTGTNPPLAQTSTSLGSSNYNLSGLVSSTYWLLPAMIFALYGM